MRYRIPLALSFLLAALGATTAVAAPAPPGHPASQGTLLITTDAPCTLYVDVEKIATLDAHASRKLSASPGEHLVTAVAQDGRRWEKVVEVRGDQRVVRIDWPAAGNGIEPASEVAAKAAPARGGIERTGESEGPRKASGSPDPIFVDNGNGYGAEGWELVDPGENSAGKALAAPERPWWQQPTWTQPSWKAPTWKVPVWQAPAPPATQKALPWTSKSQPAFGPKPAWQLPAPAKPPAFKVPPPAPQKPTWPAPAQATPPKPPTFKLPPPPKPVFVPKPTWRPPM